MLWHIRLPSSIQIILSEKFSCWMRTLNGICTFFFWSKEWTWGNKENIKTFAARSFLVTSFHIRYFFACGGREMRDSEKAISDHCDVEDGGNFHFYDVMLLLAWVFLGFCREKWAMLLGMNMILLEVMFGLEVWRFLDTWSIAWGPL